MKTAADVLREKGGEMICVSAETTVQDALKLMVEKKIGAILVKENDKIVGIWTERDLMRNTITEGFDSRTSRVKDYMVTGLVSAKLTQSIYQLLDKFLGIRLRHLLIENEEGEYVGIISVGDVVKAKLMEKTEELEKLHHIVSWDFYEDWKWKKKH